MPKNIIYLNYLNPFYKNELNINNDLNKKYYASQRDYAKIFNEISEIFEKIFIKKTKEYYLQDIAVVCHYDIMYLAEIIKEIKFTSNLKSNKKIFYGFSKMNKSQYLKFLLNKRLNRMKKNQDFTMTYRDLIKNVLFLFYNIFTNLFSSKKKYFSLEKVTSKINDYLVSKKISLNYLSKKKLLSNQYFNPKREKELINKIDFFVFTIKKKYNLKNDKIFETYTNNLKKNFLFWLTKFNYLEKNYDLLPFIHWKFGNTAVRLIGTVQRRKKKSIGFMHANFGTCLHSQWSYHHCEICISSEVVSLTKQQSNYYQNRLRISRPLLTKTKILNENKFFDKKFIIKKISEKKKILVKGYPYGGDIGPYYLADGPLINMNLELNIISELKKKNFQFKYKIHPDRINENKKLFLKYSRIEFGDFKEIIHEYDTIIFPTIFSSTFFDSIFENINIILFYHKSQFTLQKISNLRERMNVIEYCLDAKGIPHFSIKKFLNALNNKIDYNQFSNRKIFNN